MMKDSEDARQARTRQILEDADRLVKEIDATLARGRRTLEERGMDRRWLEAHAERVAKSPQIQAHVDQAMAQVRREAEQAAFLRSFEARAPLRSRRLRHLV